MSLGINPPEDYQDFYKEYWDASAVSQRIKLYHQHPIQALAQILAVLLPIQIPVNMPGKSSSRGLKCLDTCTLEGLPASRLWLTQPQPLQPLGIWISLSLFLLSSSSLPPPNSVILSNKKINLKKIGEHCKDIHASLIDLQFIMIPVNIPTNSWRNLIRCVKTIFGPMLSQYYSNSQEMGTPSIHPSSDEWIGKMWYTCTMEHNSITKGWNLVIYNKDRTEGH